MSNCKRMTVKAIGVRGKYIQTATNNNVSECKDVPGACGCTHAEIALLKKINPKIIIVSHSPCLDCAKAILKSDTQILVYENEYRLKDGLELLRKNNIKCIQLEQKKVEKLTHDDIEELMGVHRDTYTRRNGAIRRK